MTDSADNYAPRVRPVRPWQHWRFALTVTVCWLARRHFLRFQRDSAAGYGMYRCQVCRQSIIRRRPTPPEAGQS